MNTSSRDPKLDICGCCKAELPEPDLSNRPGQLALSYRIGTHSSFLRRMLARLHSQRIPSKPNEAPPLANLSTRAGDDPSLALLDAMAVAADVLTFYQERIANEGYLRTATERRSVLEMARSIGYELKPGVAAGTYLSFTVEDADGAPRMVTVSKGTQVQSIPPQGKLPQTFETTEELEARGDWNVLKPQLKEKQKFEVGTTKP